MQHQSLWRYPAAQCRPRYGLHVAAAAAVRAKSFQHQARRRWAPASSESPPLSRQTFPHQVPRPPLLPTSQHKSSTKIIFSATVSPNARASSLASLAASGERHALRKLDLSHCGMRDVGAGCVAVMMMAGDKLEKVGSVTRHASHATRHTSHTIRLKSAGTASLAPAAPTSTRVSTIAGVWRSLTSGTTGDA